MGESTTRLYVRVSSGGRISEVSEAWDALAMARGLEAFSAAALHGRPVVELLAPGEPRRRFEAWLADLWASAPLGSGPLPASPAAPDELCEVCSWARALVAWPSMPPPSAPAPSERELPGQGGEPSLLLAVRLPGWCRLRGPYFVESGAGSSRSPQAGAPQAGSGRLEPVGLRGAGLLEREPELATRQALEERLAFLRPPRMLEPTGLLAGSRDVLAVRWPRVHRQGGFRLLARALRGALHDSSNSLAGVRMLAEVLVRGGARSFERHEGTLTSMIEHLDRVTGKLGEVRQLAHTAAHRERMDGRSLLESVVETSRTARELREIEVDLGGVGPFTIEGRRDLWQILLAGALSSSLDRANDGDRMVLRSMAARSMAARSMAARSTGERVDPSSAEPGGHRLELWIEGGERPWWSVDDGADGELPGSLARAVGGRFELGHDDEATPRLDWHLEWPAATAKIAAG